jgi:hypothetical protein
MKKQISACHSLKIVKAFPSSLAMSRYSKVLPVQGTNTWRFDTSDGGSLPTNTNDGELNGGALRVFDHPRGVERWTRYSKCLKQTQQTVFFWDKT